MPQCALWRFTTPDRDNARELRRGGQIGGKAPGPMARDSIGEPCPGVGFPRLQRPRSSLLAVQSSLRSRASFTSRNPLAALALAASCPSRHGRNRGLPRHIGMAAATTVRKVAQRDRREIASKSQGFETGTISASNGLCALIEFLHKMGPSRTALVARHGRSALGPNAGRRRIGSVSIRPSGMFRTIHPAEYSGDGFVCGHRAQRGQCRSLAPIGSIAPNAPQIDHISHLFCRWPVFYLDRQSDSEAIQNRTGETRSASRCRRI